MMGATPQMGWNSWNAFGCHNITAALVKGQADKLVAAGLDKLGYTYINIDDCWQNNTRNATGYLMPNMTAFPDGMKDVADYVHGKGLKLGIYSSAGTKTCAGYPGSLGYEK